MRPINTPEANSYLRSIGMEIGAWNKIADAPDPRPEERTWVHYEAPSVARELVVFSQHVAGWLPRGDWKLLQIDNSTSLDYFESALLGRLLLGSMETPNFAENRSFIFEFDEKKIHEQKHGTDDMQCYTSFPSIRMSWVYSLVW
jgi:hypothetical protein